jgi:hypothetical protein
MSEISMMLLRHNVDTRSWGQDGKKGLWDLVWEIQHGICELRVDHNEKEKRLKRFSLQLCLKLHCDTHTKGLCVMQEKNTKTPGKYITKKMEIADQDWRAKCLQVLEKYFNLDRQFISRYVVVLNHKVLQDDRPSFYYPGLTARYTTHEVDLWLINNKTHDHLGLPWGTDFATRAYDEANIKHKEQDWFWDPQHEGFEVIKQQLLRAYAYGVSYYKLDEHEGADTKEPKRVVIHSINVKDAKNKSGPEGRRRTAGDIMRRRGTQVAVKPLSARKGSTVFAEPFLAF